MVLGRPDYGVSTAATIFICLIVIPMGCLQEVCEKREHTPNAIMAGLAFALFVVWCIFHEHIVALFTARTICLISYATHSLIKRSSSSCGEIFGAVLAIVFCFSEAVITNYRARGYTQQNERRNSNVKNPRILNPRKNKTHHEIYQENETRKEIIANKDGMIAERDNMIRHLTICIIGLVIIMITLGTWIKIMYLSR
ncbi:hypothetical protein Ddc_13837 [Ditylenchus destructor]|nr:hypothetical protein Ddc_13837 [Ditylenchus destructor]